MVISMRNNEKLHTQRYVHTFIMFSNHVELWLIRMIAMLVILLLFSQCVLQFTPVRHFLSNTDQLEGKVFEIGNLGIKPEVHQYKGDAARFLQDL